MDLKPVLTIKPSTFDHEKVKQAVLKNIHVIHMNMTGQSYGLHARLIDSVKKIQDKHNHPLGVIHSIHPDADDLDIRMAVGSGAHAVSVSSISSAHINKIRQQTKKTNMPILAQVDTAPKNEEELKKIVDGFIVQSKYLKLFNFKSDQKKNLLVRHLLYFASHAEAAVLAVGDWESARIISSINPEITVAFVSKDKSLISRACLLSCVIPVLMKGTVLGSLQNAGIISKGQRLINAVDVKSGVTIELAL